MSEFYISLHSNACSNTFPSNTTSDFRNKLSDTISINSEWEVCLFDISYIYGHVILGTDEHLFTIIENDAKKNVTRYNRIYSYRNIRTIDDLVQELKVRLPATRLEIDGKIFRMQLNTEKYIAIYFAEKVSDILGLNDRGIIVNKDKFIHVENDLSQGKGPAFIGTKNATIRDFTARYHDAKERKDTSVVDIWGDTAYFEQAGWTKMFVYTNIIEPQYISDVRANCIKTVPYKGQYGEVVHHSFLQSQYVNVSVSSLELIHVYILSETGQPIKFDFSPISITLKFREKRLR